jgi:hypothetical protein
MMANSGALLFGSGGGVEPESRRGWNDSTERPALGFARAVAFFATASVMALSNTMVVLRLSIGSGSTANTFAPFSAAFTCLSFSAVTNTTIEAWAAWACAWSTSARTSRMSRVSTTNSWPRLVPQMYSTAAAAESTGRTEAWPPSASPNSRRKSSRVVMAVTSTAGLLVEAGGVPAEPAAAVPVS